MGRARLDDDRGVTVRLTTPTRVTAIGGPALSASAGSVTLGTWRVARVTDSTGRTVGSGLEVLPPAGDGQPLAVSTTVAYPGVSWGPGAVLGSLHPGDSDATDLRITVNKPVLLRLVVTAESGRTVLTRELGLAEQGVHWVRWFHDGADGERVAAGRYRVQLVGVDQAGTEGGEASRVITLP